MGTRRKLLLILVLGLFLFGSVTVAHGVTLDDILDKIDDTKEQLSENEKEIKELNKDIQSLQGRITATEADIQELDQLIAQKTQELGTKKTEITKTNDELNARLRQMYKAGTVSFVDIILSSESITDLVSNMEMLAVIHKNDQTLLASLQQSYNTLEAQKQELVALQNSLDAKKASLADDKADMSKKKAQVSAENKKLEAQLDALNKEADRLIEEIRRNSGGGAYVGGELLWPAPGYYRITSEFGYRIHPILGYKKLHTGIDIAAPYGATVVASNSGKIIASYYNSSYGNMIIVDHGGGIVTLYAHLSSRLVSLGETVKRGETIGKVGSTGMSTGAHLHFEVRVNGVYEDPRSYL
jgi:murein DD-endopeptidase MepM/ murein hydrolase activator NlpD